MSDDYLHGYSEHERERLAEQARFTEPFVFEFVELGATRELLEVGCGVGAQSEILLRRYPQLRLFGIDVSPSQIAAAHARLRAIPAARDRYELYCMDATALTFPSRRFDGAFLCWVLEHTPDPLAVLAEVRRVLGSGAVVHVTEVMNQTFFVTPYSPAVETYWRAFNDLQLELGGDPNIGARLGNLLAKAGFDAILTRPRVLSFDARDPVALASMIDYWSDLLMSAHATLIERRRIDVGLGALVRAELRRVAGHPDGAFHYSFMQARARCPD
ncbi:MAG: class I SAM-dependent methyltransferase [Planctomycetota bacterium]